MRTSSEMTVTAGVIRRPAVAGYYYSSDARLLGRQIDGWAQRVVAPTSARAVIVPHGSYQHSGAIAGRTVAGVVIPRRCVVLGPSHAGSWMPWSVMAAGAYRTPLGDVPVDARCADALRQRCSFLEADAWAQRGEHAIEVQLPLLQRLGPPDLSVVPIIVNSDDQGELAQMASALAQVVMLLEEPVLLMATADLSHYQPHARTLEHDRILIEAMGALDAARLLYEVQERGVTMCGLSTVLCVLAAAQQLGALRATLAAYGTSADAGADPDAVIGYAGMVIC